MSKLLIKMYFKNWCIHYTNNNREKYACTLFLKLMLQSTFSFLNYFHSRKKISSVSLPTVNEKSYTGGIEPKSVNIDTKSPLPFLHPFLFGYTKCTLKEVFFLMTIYFPLQNCKSLRVRNLEWTDGFISKSL